MKIIRLDAGKLAALLGDGSGLPGEPAEMIGQLVPVIDILPFLVGAAEVPLQEPAAGIIRTSELWGHSGQRISPSGGAGNFSGLGSTYEAEGLAAGITKLQIVALLLGVNVDAILRLYHENVDVFVPPGDLGNLETNIRSNTDGVFGFADWTAQVVAPDTVPIPNHSGRLTRLLLDVPELGAGGGLDFQWLITMPALWTRNLTAQTQAMGWGIWARAAATAITASYSVIVRKLPA